MPDSFFKPVSGFDLPRFAGVPTFMRLPNVPVDHPRFEDVDIGLIGVPWDSGTPPAEISTRSTRVEMSAGKRPPTEDAATVEARK